MRHFPIAIETTALAPEKGVIIEACLGATLLYSRAALAPLAVAMQADQWIGRNHRVLFGDLVTACSLPDSEALAKVGGVAVPDLDAALCEALGALPGEGSLALIAKRWDWLSPWLARHTPAFSGALRSILKIDYTAIGDAMAACGHAVPSAHTSLRAKCDCTRLHAGWGTVRTSLITPYGRKENV